MKHAIRTLIVAAATLAVLGLPLGATAFPASVSTHVWTKNLHPLGEALAPNTLGVVNSDIAFWGRTAIQGTYNGFNIIDISDPENPVKVLDYNECAMDVIPGTPTASGSQGDIVIWGNILVRAWNSNTGTPNTGTNARFCDGDLLPASFEGLNIFDISNPLNPDHIALVDLPQGSHTLSLLPDVEHGRLLVYNSASSAANPGIDIVEIPLANPAAPVVLRREDSGRSCHDTGIILGDVMRVACSGGNGFTMWSLDPADGATLTDPVFMYSQVVPGVGVGHTAAFSWDGEIFIFGHEPGGGVQPSCEATDPVNDRSIFFFDTDTGALVGTHVLPRPQLNSENCTIHNLNVVPLPRQGKKELRRVLVHGSYQSGIGVVDFSDPTNAVEFAYADPAPLVPEFDGGDWSSYWYNGHIYESDMTRGVMVWNLSDHRVAGALRVSHSNPQTQEFSIH